MVSFLLYILTICLRFISLPNCSFVLIADAYLHFLPHLVYLFLLCFFIYIISYSPILESGWVSVWAAYLIKLQKDVTAFLVNLLNVSVWFFLFVAPAFCSFLHLHFPAQNSTLDPGIRHYYSRCRNFTVFFFFFPKKTCMYLLR